MHEMASASAASSPIIRTLVAPLRCGGLVIELTAQQGAQGVDIFGREIRRVGLVHGTGITPGLPEVEVWYAPIARKCCAARSIKTCDCHRVGIDGVSDCQIALLDLRPRVERGPVAFENDAARVQNVDFVGALTGKPEILFAEEQA